MTTDALMLPTNFRRRFFVVLLIFIVSSCLTSLIRIYCLKAPFEFGHPLESLVNDVVGAIAPSALLALCLPEIMRWKGIGTWGGLIAFALMTGWIGPASFFSPLLFFHIAPLSSNLAGCLTVVFVIGAAVTWPMIPSWQFSPFIIVFWALVFSVGSLRGVDFARQNVFGAENYRVASVMQSDAVTTRPNLQTLADAYCPGLGLSMAEISTRPWVGGQDSLLTNRLCTGGGIKRLLDFQLFSGQSSPLKVIRQSVYLNRYKKGSEILFVFRKRYRVPSQEVRLPLPKRDAVIYWQHDDNTWTLFPANANTTTRNLILTTSSIGQGDAKKKTLCIAFEDVGRIEGNFCGIEALETTIELASAIK